MLSQVTLDKADPDKLLLPNDLQYRPIKFQTLFTKPALIRLPGRRKRESKRHGEQANPPQTDVVIVPLAAVDESSLVSDSVAGGHPLGDQVDGGLQYQSDNDDSQNNNHGNDSFQSITPPVSSEIQVLPPNNNVAETPNSQVAIGDDGGFLQLVAQPQKVEKIDIHFAKFAKKVDVRQLKDGLWSVIKKGIPANKPHQENSQNSPPKVKSFQSAIQEMTKVLPSGDLSNLSVSFCFICLLHLCNEKNLSLGNFGEKQTRKKESKNDLEITSKDKEKVDELSGAEISSNQPIDEEICWSTPQEETDQDLGDFLISLRQTIG